MFYKNLICRKSNIRDFRKSSHAQNHKSDYFNAPKFNFHLCPRGKHPRFSATEKIILDILRRYFDLFTKIFRINVIFFAVPKKAAHSSQIKVTKMLLIVSTVFVCLNLPSYIMRIKAFLVEVNASFNFFLRERLNTTQYFKPDFDRFFVVQISRDSLVQNNFAPSPLLLLLQPPVQRSISTLP